MASTVGLVPITRAFLSTFYDKYPITPLSSDVTTLVSSCKEEALRMHAASPEDPGSSVLIGKLDFVPPQKIDENTWRNREQVEELLYLFDKNHWPSSLKAQDSPSTAAVAASLPKLAEELQSVMTTIQEFQKSSSERIFSMVLTYMPQDFRSALLKQQRERSEKRRQGEVDALVAAGGSIQDKYALLWQQQMERRKQLAALGSATGVFRTLVKWLVGVPQVLLDFVCQINDDHGPMEEQRARYGPPLYQLTSFSIALRVFVSFWWSSFDQPSSPTDEHLLLLEKSVTAYSSEMKRFLKFLQEVFENSPFLISAEEAGIANTGDDYKEAIIIAGKTHEVSVTVECEGSLVAWDFQLTAGKDVGFSVEFLDTSSMKRRMLPYQRYDSHQGNFFSPSVGAYKLIWDNSYSTFYRKTLRYKVDLIPPELDTPEKSEEASSHDVTPPIEGKEIADKSAEGEAVTAEREAITADL